MSNDTCAEMHLLLNADLDGELAPADSARVAAHMAGCTTCAELATRLARLSDRISREVVRETAPVEVRSRVCRQVRPRRAVSRPTAAFVAGLAVAACAALFLVPREASSPDELAASHVRALQPGHLLDVPSSDQHTVKPWFSGKLDFTPPVRDFAEQGFALAGGRLDYVGGRPVAVLVYRRRQHVIELYVWPAGASEALEDRRSHGFNIEAWAADGLAFRAISDLEAGELAQLAWLLRSQH